MENGVRLAGRGRRLVAALADIILVPVGGFLLVVVTGAIEHAEDYAGFQIVINILLCGLGSYLLQNGWHLTMRGQTLGKAMLGIRIADFGTSDKPPFWRLFARALVGLVLPLVDLVTLFGKDRRCLHDFVCSTWVIDRAG